MEAVISPARLRLSDPLVACLAELDTPGLPIVLATGVVNDEPRRETTPKGMEVVNFVLTSCGPHHSGDPARSCTTKIRVSAWRDVGRDVLRRVPAGATVTVLGTLQHRERRDEDSRISHLYHLDAHQVLTR